MFVTACLPACLPDLTANNYLGQERIDGSEVSVGSPGSSLSLAVPTPLPRSGKSGFEHPEHHEYAEDNVKGIGDVHLVLPQQILQGRHRRSGAATQSVLGP